SGVLAYSYDSSQNHGVRVAQERILKAQEISGMNLIRDSKTSSPQTTNRAGELRSELARKIAYLMGSSETRTSASTVPYRLGGLRQATLRRTRTRAALPGPLHP